MHKSVSCFRSVYIVVPSYIVTYIDIDMDMNMGMEMDMDIHLHTHIQVDRC